MQVNLNRKQNPTLELIGSEEVQAIVGTITPPEAMVVSEIGKATRDMPIICLRARCLLDSVDASALYNMQGVLGCRINFLDSTESFRRFKTKFRKRYGTRYAVEEEYSSPSIYTLRDYDTAWTITQANATSKELLKQLLSSNFEGLSGRIRFRDKTLLQHRTFQTINVVGKSYREVAIWSPDMKESTLELFVKVSYDQGLCFRSRYCAPGKKARPFHTGQGKGDTKVGIYIFLMNVAKLSHVGSSRKS
ncbi:hypothetical protein V6N13_144040 [Hibiscus sabdariffa]